MIGDIQTQSIHDIQHNRRRLQGYQLIVHIGVRLKKPQIGKRASHLAGKRLPLRLVLDQQSRRPHINRRSNQYIKNSDT